MAVLIFLSLSACNRITNLKKVMHVITRFGNNMYLCRGIQKKYSHGINSNTESKPQKRNGA